MNSSTKKKIRYIDLSSDSTPLEWLGLKARRAAWCSAAASLPIGLGLYADHVRAGDRPTADRNERRADLDNCGKPWPLSRRKGFLLPNQAANGALLSELAGGGDDCPGMAIPPGTYSRTSPFRDSGTTVGANDTVSETRYIDYCYYRYNSRGPDQIYSFRLTGLGANPKIEVAANSATYQPMIYILETRNGVGCTPGTGFNDSCRLRVTGYAPTPGGTATLERQQLNQLPFNVELFLFIDAQEAGPHDSGPYTLRIQDVGIAPEPPPPPPAPVTASFDFDGDQRSDISVFRPSNGFWWLRQSNRGIAGTQLGISTDSVAPADLDGDGKTDIAVFRDGVWFWLNSSTGTFQQAAWGIAGDLPVPADYSGDGRAELTVYRGGTWFTYNIRSGLAQAIQFGLPDDKPVPADYDGDGRPDLAVYRDGIWYLQRSSAGFAALPFGLPTDRLVPGDYDADGRADLAVYRDGIWYVQRSLDGFTAFQFGIATDDPAPADYDGDGRADAAVFRDGIWYLRQPTGGFEAVRFGLAGDRPVPGAFVR